MSLNVTEKANQNSASGCLWVFFVLPVLGILGVVAVVGSFAAASAGPVAAISYFQVPQMVEKISVQAEKSWDVDRSEWMFHKDRDSAKIKELVFVDSQRKFVENFRVSDDEMFFRVAMRGGVNGPGGNCVDVIVRAGEAEQGPRYNC